MDIKQAEEALAAAVEADRAALNNPSGTPQPEQAEPTAHEAPAESTEGTTAQDSLPFEGINPAELPPELIPIYKGMQAKFTQTQQTLAEQARAYEAIEQFGGVDAARQAVDFVQALAYDPETQLQLHEELTQHLQAQGLTRAQASAEASRQVDEAVSQAQVDEDDYGFDEIPKQITSRIDSLEQELAAERRWREQQEMNQLNQTMASSIDRMEAEVRSKHPEWKESDIDATYDLAYSTGADLVAAADKWAQMKASILSEWLETKASVTAPSNIPATGSAQSPTKYEGLHDPSLDRDVAQRLAELSALENS